MKEEKKRKKGKITPIGLSIKKGYVTPASRRLMIVLGFIGCVAVMGWYFFDASFLQNSFSTSGPVSSNHADFEQDCAKCHDLRNEVTDALCSSCHEKTSEFMVYDFTAHYLYRSKDFSRLSEDSLQKHASMELNCGSCHLEHLGRQASISNVTDAKCITCHEFGSFNENHPEFEFIEKSIPDDSTMIMTHIRHTHFILAKLQGQSKLDDATIASLKKSAGEESLYFFEQACLYCHTPDEDGKNFTNINFDQHCGDCHVAADAAVIGLPKFSARNPKQAGVETITDIRYRGGPGVTWAYNANPNLVVNEDGEVSKSPVVHKDQWILENLKQIRSRVYGKNQLQDLLNTVGPTEQNRVDTLYSEAIQKLRDYTNEFAGRADLKGDMIKLNSLLNIAKKKLKQPDENRSQEMFALPMDSKKLSEDQKQAYLQLALDLTSGGGPECQKCHIVENAGILHVQADQDLMVKSEFDHRAHILETRCTECHDKIRVDEETMRLSVDNLAEFKAKFPDVFMSDKSATQNMPDLSSCMECHSDKKVSNNCTACHKFHPNKENRSSLQIFSTNLN